MSICQTQQRCSFLSLGASVIYWAFEKLFQNLDEFSLNIKQNVDDVVNLFISCDDPVIFLGT